jgi:hypothetical protein
MTANIFAVECSKRSIDPAIALENENVRNALAQRDDERVRQLLDTEF